jgi:hypothetical protein
MRIYEPKRDEVRGEWRKLHNEDLHILYSFPNITRHIKSRRMKWASHVARMGKERKVYKILVGKPGGKRRIGRPRRRWRVGSDWMLGILAGSVWSGLSWLRIGTGSGLL